MKFNRDGADPVFVLCSVTALKIGMRIINHAFYFRVFTNATSMNKCSQNIIKPAYAVWMLHLANALA